MTPGSSLPPPLIQSLNAQDSDPQHLPSNSQDFVHVSASGLASSEPRWLSHPDSVLLPDPSDGHSDAAPLSEGSAGSDPPPYKLRWSKSKVYLHPSIQVRDNVPGYLGITQRTAGSFYLSWLPEHAIQDSTERDRWVKLELDPQSEEQTDLVTVPSPQKETFAPQHAFCVPIKSIHCLILRPPTLTSWHGSVTINLFSGPTLPTLHFHDDESRSTQFMRETRESRVSQGRWSSLPCSWGGEALLTQLGRFAQVCPSMTDSGLFLINPSSSERDRHLTPVFSDDAILPPSLPGRTSILHKSLTTRHSPAAMDDFTFHFLNSFSRLTRNAKSAAQMVLSHRLAKPIIPHLPEPIASLANGEPEFIKWSQQAGVEGYDTARVYLAKWAALVAAQGEYSPMAQVGEWDPEPSGQQGSLGTLGGDFEMIHATLQVPKERLNRVSTSPIELPEFLAWQTPESGQLMLDETEGRKRIFQRGLGPGARKEIWMFLLGVYTWESTSEERDTSRKVMAQEYMRLRQSWESDMELWSTSDFQDEAHRIEIDCKRTDRNQPYFSTPSPGETNNPAQKGARDESPVSNPHVEAVGKVLMTYNIWEKDLGYVQGMSDLCAPLYVVCEADEALTFFAFVRLMDKMKSHFLRDQSGMRDELCRLQQLLSLMDPELYHHFEKTNSLNLFFCFRWVLVCFKREFEFGDVLKVWEALWTNVCGPHGDLFLALAILQLHREPMIRYLREFDEVLKYANDIAMTLDCEELIGQAEVLYLLFKSTLETRSTLSPEGLQVVKNGKRTIVVTDELKSLI